ncbi:hypothetical protein GQ43DRAFT_279254 [Delitschia confertaspora ATCC 74209]|uniref:Rhodopsin domain-containing protein n=1 Tax=Delitschia confertaspora ATCC 74209 TaxID=1513339 RepID=A0A9P4JTW1_9PLEO|nr:hypothetical protein GQ43DRAFT_279254 [Delitschia confertaspora ATCC 74209]
MHPLMPEHTSIPWDTSVGNRFAPYNDSNHSATLWIASLLGLIYAFGTLFIRIFVKIKVLGIDDYLIIASSLAALGQFITIFEGLTHGLGKSSELVPDVVSIGKWVFSSRLLLLISLYLAKCSGMLLLRRLFVRDDRSNSMLCDISLGFIVICGITSVFVGTIGCPSSTFFAQHCDSQVMRWSVVTGLDVITEVISLVIPPYLVWQLQMKTEFKLRVISAFSFRILVIVFSVLHLDAWIKYTNAPASPFTVVPTLIWQQTLLGYTLVSATIPNLKAFLQSLSTNWGIDWGYSSNAYGTNGTFEMSNMKRSAVGSHIEADIPFSRQPSKAKFRTEVKSTVRDHHSIGSHDSQDLIIRKDTHFVIETEEVDDDGIHLHNHISRKK